MMVPITLSLIEC